MEILDRSDVHIRDKDEVETLLNKLKEGGENKLQIIADFDRTITKSEVNGKVTASTFGILEDSPFMPATLREETVKNTEHYFPLEMDPHLTVEEKIPLVIEWYNKNFNLIVQSHYNKANLRAMVHQSNAELRDGCNDLLELTYNLQIPMLIVSAGLGDVLEEILNGKAQLHPNIKIVANFMTFDDEGYVNGIKGEFIHTFNKHTAMSQDPEYFNNILHRDNVIMLGDSHGDIGMVSDIDDSHNILKIGFLNYRVEESLPLYKEMYDIVITKNQTMDVVNKLLQFIINQK